MITAYELTLYIQRCLSNGNISVASDLVNALYSISRTDSEKQYAEQIWDRNKDLVRKLFPDVEKERPTGIY